MTTPLILSSQQVSDEMIEWMDMHDHINLKFRLFRQVCDARDYAFVIIYLEDTGCIIAPYGIWRDRRNFRDAHPLTKDATNRDYKWIAFEWSTKMHHKTLLFEDIENETAGLVALGTSRSTMMGHTYHEYMHLSSDIAQREQFGSITIFDKRIGPQ